MKKQRLALVLLLSASVPMLGSTYAQDSNTLDPQTQSPSTTVTNTTNHLVTFKGGTIVRPQTSVPAVNQGTTPKTRMMHTNIELMVPPGWKASEVSPPRPDVEPPVAGDFYETPASLACLYGLVTVTAGCNPQTVTANPTGGTKSIAIVDAYDDPFIGPDLAYFSAQMGLPFSPSKFEVVYEGGTPPGIDETGGWELEEALDVEYAHAMAPGAMIYLVEAQAPDTYDLMASVAIAANLVHCAKPTTCPTTATGTGEVSMSWGEAEYAGETANDPAFNSTNAPGVVFVASAGDNPGTEYPCVSINVVCAGGTSLRRNPSTGAFMNEWSWPLGGGGLSQYEKTPSYQSSIASIVGTARGVPDFAMDSDPYTGLWVWSSFQFLIDLYGLDQSSDAGWWIVGGTSAATPTMAGIINRAGHFFASSNAELTTMYNNKAVAADYTDTTAGDCGPYMGWAPATGWDPCTGIGSPKGYVGK